MEPHISPSGLWRTPRPWISAILGLFWKGTALLKIPEPGKEAPWLARLFGMGYRGVLLLTLHCPQQLLLKGELFVPLCWVSVVVRDYFGAEIFLDQAAEFR